MLPVQHMRQCRLLEARQDRKGEVLKLSYLLTPGPLGPSLSTWSSRPLIPCHILLQAVAVNTTTEAKVKVAINGFGRIGKLPGVYRIS